MVSELVKEANLEEEMQSPQSNSKCLQERVGIYGNLR